MPSLEGKVAIVTGAGRGIGREHSLALAKAGAKVVVNDLGGSTHGEGSDQTPAQQVADEIKEMGGEAVANNDNVADWEGGQRLVNTAIETFGRLDVLVNNAGIGIAGPIEEHQTKRLDLQLDVNLRGVYLTLRECIPMLKEAGKEHRKALALNTASIAGKFGQGWLAAYSATKFGVVGLTQAMHRELSGDGIQCTALCPGFVATAMTDWVEETVDKEEMIQPEDIAEAVRYLLRTSPNCIVPEIQFVRPGDTP